MLEVVLDDQDESGEESKAAQSHCIDRGGLWHIKSVCTVAGACSSFDRSTGSDFFPRQFPLTGTTLMT